MGDSKGPIRLKGLFVFGAVTLGLGYAVPIAGWAAGPQAALGAGSAPSPVASTPALGSPPRINRNSVLVGFSHATALMTVSLDYPTREVEDSSLPMGRRTVDQVGAPGVRVERIDQTLEDGFVVDQRTLTEQVTPPIEQVTRVGTRPPDPPSQPPAATAAASDPALSGARVISGSATSYCLTGHTATGSLAGPGSIAVDPAVIPLRSHLFVPGYGYGWAVDTGSAIQGTLIDLLLDCDAAIRWGRRQVTIYVLPS